MAVSVLNRFVLDCLFGTLILPRQAHSATKNRTLPLTFPIVYYHFKQRDSAKEILRRGFWATLNFLKFKLALNRLRRISLNFAKMCILSCWLQFDNKKWGSSSSFLSYKRLKLNFRVFLASHIVAMVTYSATKLTATCLPMIGQFVAYPKCFVRSRHKDINSFVFSCISYRGLRSLELCFK